MRRGEERKTTSRVRAPPPPIHHFVCRPSGPFSPALSYRRARRAGRAARARPPGPSPRGRPPRRPHPGGWPGRRPRRAAGAGGGWPGVAGSGRAWRPLSGEKEKRGTREKKGIRRERGVRERGRKAPRRRRLHSPADARVAGIRPTLSSLTWRRTQAASPPPARVAVSGSCGPACLWLLLLPGPRARPGGRMVLVVVAWSVRLAARPASR